MALEKVMMGLDLGSSWIRAVVGSVAKDGTFTVDSICERPSEGIFNGVVQDSTLAIKSITSIIQEAELQAGTKIDSVVVGIGGSTIECRQSEGVAGITTKGLEISSSDIFRSLEGARTFEIPPNRVVIHTLVQDFSVDGKSGIKDPINMTGHRLESRTLVVTGDENNCQNIKKCMTQAGISYSRLVVQQIADSEVVLSQEEKDNNTILINLGSNCSNILVYSKGAPIYVGGIDLGGLNVTNDIAYMTNRSVLDAEFIKYENGSCHVPSIDPNETIVILQSEGLPSIKMPKRELAKIICSRMEEIFYLLKKKLEENNIFDSFGSVVLVGGGSLLSGVPELASEVFCAPARIGFPEAFSGLDRAYINPKYTTVLGLIKTEAKKLKNTGKNSKKTRIALDRPTLFQRLSTFLKTVI